MKRRVFISLGLGGLAAVMGSRHFPPFLNLPLVRDITCTDTPSEEAGFSLRFAATGDAGTGRSNQRRVAGGMLARWCNNPFQTVLLLGDNIYEDGDIVRIGEVFEQPYSKLLQRNVKFYAALGNHDVRTRQGEDEIAYSNYNMSGRYYTFTQQSVQFFALDTNQFHTKQNDNGATPWSVQLQWLESELARSQAPWKIIFAHHPIYSSGYHGSDDELRKSLSPLFKAYNVQFYLNGHDHHYERTHPINGTTYITAGNGGRNLRRVGESKWTAYADKRYGFITFDVYDDRLVTKAIDTGGNSFDEATTFLS
ncbi:MAG: metallophosphoesterase [Cyanobacteria bacterium P01_F01_bin.3]